MTFSVYLFVAVFWLPGGAIDGPPIARIEATLGRCMADRDEVASRVAVINRDNLPTMQMSYHTECHLVLNESVATGS